MFTSQTAFVVLPPFRIVGLDVSQMVPAQFIDGFFDLDDAVVLPHGFRGEIRVCPRSIPISWHGFGVEPRL